MSSEAGPAFPHDFGDPRAEYLAARDSAALFRLPARTHIELNGRDRAKFLHNFCTNDIRGLPPGGVCEAFITNVQGKILAFVSIYALPEAHWLTTVPGCAEAIIQHLSRYQISEDVTFTDRSGECSTLLVAGPHAPEIVGRILPTAATLDPPSAAESTFERAPIQVRRHDFLRVPGFVLVAAPQVVEIFSGCLKSAGAVSAGQNAFDALRIEAGFPLYGVDLNNGNLAQEAGRTAQAISFTKGCYLGQEPIARIDALGHVNQQLRCLRLERGDSPAPASEVVTQDSPPRKVGTITSSAVSYADGKPVALAMLRRGFESPGVTLDVTTGGGSVPAVVFWPAD